VHKSKKFKAERHNKQVTRRARKQAAKPKAPKSRRGSRQRTDPIKSRSKGTSVQLMVQRAKSKPAHETGYQRVALQQRVIALIQETSQAIDQRFEQWRKTG
jgi:hypothetical protein